MAASKLSPRQKLLQDFRRTLFIMSPILYLSSQSHSLRNEQGMQGTKIRGGQPHCPFSYRVRVRVMAVMKPASVS